MSLSRTLLTAAVLLASSGVAATTGPVVPTVNTASGTTIARGTLRDLDGAVVGQISIERQERMTYVKVVAAGRVAGPNLELMVSASTRALKAGDYSGPGPSAVRVGRIEQAQVRYALPTSVRPESLRSVWIWCRSVRLPAARALLLSARF